MSGNLLKNIFIRSIVLALLFEYTRTEIVSLTVATVLAAYEVVIWAKELWHWLQYSWDWVKGLFSSNNDKNQITDQNRQFYHYVSTDLRDLSNKIDDLMHHQQEKLQELAELMVETSSSQRITQSLNDLFIKLEDVKRDYELLLMRLPESSEEVSTKDLCYFGVYLLNGDYLLRKILSIKDELSRYSLFDADYWGLLKRKLKDDGSTACGKGHSGYEFMHSIYNHIMITEMQGYFTLVFSHYFVYDNQGKEGCTYFSDSAEDNVASIFDDFQERMRFYAEFFLPQLKGLRNDFRNCSAPLQREETFIELEGAIQVTGITSPWTRCWKLPYHYDRSYYCRNDYYCYQLPQTCRGYLAACREDNLYGNFCLDSPYSSRRYKWVKPDYYWDYAPKKSECSEYYQSDTRDVYNCLCQCFENEPSSKSTHLVNLQAVMADYQNNMVVTGLRFVIKHRVLHLQIQQGQLNRFFQVHNAKWKPVNDIAQEIYAVRTKKKFRDASPNISEYNDYYVINYPFNWRLNDIQVPEWHVLTGVKLHWVTRQEMKMSMIELVIFSSPFNHTTGVIQANVEPQMNLGGASAKKVIFDRRYPLDYDSRKPPIEVPAENGYIEFRESNWEEDSGQTTVPLFDATDLVSVPASPLGGVGIFLKQADKSAALISLKFYSLNYEVYMKESLDNLVKAMKKKELESKLKPVKRKEFNFNLLEGEEGGNEHKRLTIANYDITG